VRFFTALKVFFAVLFNREKAERVVPLLEGNVLPVLTHEQAGKEREDGKEQKKSVSRPFQQSEAIVLLAALQREARLIDFLKENLDSYDDAQVGAAARSVHDQCATVLERFFDIQPLRIENEQSILEISVPEIASVQLTGNISGNPPYRGQLTHHGWKATKCELPKWSGTEQSAFVLAPAEIEIE